MLKQRGLGVFKRVLCIVLSQHSIVGFYTEKQIVNFIN